MTEQELENYWRTMLSLSGKRADLEQDRKKLLASFKYPDSLFRFRSVSEDSLNALQENKMYFSSADYYDDPFDTYLCLDIQQEYNETVEFVRSDKLNFDYYRKFFPNASEEQFQEYKSQNLDKDAYSAKVKEVRNILQSNLYSVCFCESVENEVTWLKYAENHKGFVLEYSICEDYLNMLWNERTSNLLPIYYSNEKYNANFYASHCIMENNPSELYSSFSLYYAVKNDSIAWENTKMTVIKKLCHKYDEEWRLVPLNTLKQREFITWKPKSVTIGLRTPEYKKRLIISATQAAGISEFYQMIINERDEFVRVPLKV